MPTIDELRRYATAFRRKLDRGWHDLPFANDMPFPLGCCGAVSEALAEAIHVQFGTEPAYVAAETGGGLDRGTHAWIEIDDVIIDITADQFGQPPVIVTACSPWHQRWHVMQRRRWILESHYDLAIYQLGTSPPLSPKDDLLS